MIAKGLDFPAVTVVGVVSADLGLYQPDFRAAERTFQLLAQVAGRAGRGERPGTVIVQTLCPDHATIQLAAKNEFAKFMDLELRARHQTGYPPFTRLIRIVVESRQDASAEELGKTMRLALASDARKAGFTLLGPAPAPIRRIKGWSRWHLLVKCGTQESFAAARDAIVGSGVRSDRRQRVLVDVDPVGML
jgi:primosomal protein N' (replication factor Y)